MNIRITADDGSVIEDCEAADFRAILLLVSGLWAAQALLAAPLVAECLSLVT